jgi:predicted nucleotidyltransferase component of viral defense system
MHNAIQMMLNRYNPKNNEERQHAIKEIIQEIALAGLSRGGFFKFAAFYGGTSLRIFHGLNRFSEDLDFALIKQDSLFQFNEFFPALKKEFLSYGIELSIEEKNKSVTTAVQSAFLKANTLTLMMSFFPRSEDAKKVIDSQKIKVKFEIDTDNPIGGVTELKFRMVPAPYEVKIFDLPSLFAGKLAAVLCREYQSHVKGRDYYDYLFYIAQGIKLNLIYLENLLKKSNKIPHDAKLSLDGVKTMLTEKFNTVDFESAKQDVANFIEDKESLNLWKANFFLATLDGIKAN